MYIPHGRNCTIVDAKLYGLACQTHNKSYFKLQTQHLLNIFIELSHCTEMSGIKFCFHHDHHHHFIIKMFCYSRNIISWKRSIKILPKILLFFFFFFFVITYFPQQTMKTKQFFMHNFQWLVSSDGMCLTLTIWLDVLLLLLCILKGRKPKILSSNMHNCWIGLSHKRDAHMENSCTEK